MPTPTQEKTFLQSIKNLKHQATTTRMSDARHRKTFVGLVFDYTLNQEPSPRVIAVTSKYVREFGWV